MSGRSRNNSAARLDVYHNAVRHLLLNRMHPVTGLVSSADSRYKDHAWIRDNLYCVYPLWALSLAFRRQGGMEMMSLAFELERTIIKLMRSLLQCLMRQADRVECFKRSPGPDHSLHAKFNADTLEACVGDHEWGHLQMDAISLFLLNLAQLTVSGFNIIYTVDEVGFIQNLIYYIEQTYRIPDYGIWERGDKTNQGRTELNATSVGLAKAALESLHDLELFAGSGGFALTSNPDEIAHCAAILESMLPRESASKEVDSALLSIVGFPAFAVDNSSLIETTKTEIKEKLEGPVYGASRFLRDGYRTVAEDRNRLHYESHELKNFAGIECHWPLFYCFSLLNAIFSDDKTSAKHYRSLLDELLDPCEDTGLLCLHELYYVPRDSVAAERNTPGSQKRFPEGQFPHIWSQSLFIVAQLLMEGLISPGELDPLNRRLITVMTPPQVQICVLTNDYLTHSLIIKEGVTCEKIADLHDTKIYPGSAMHNVWTELGSVKSLGLSGRPPYDYTGIQSTSRLYYAQGHTLLFTPSCMSRTDFHASFDDALLCEDIATEVAYLIRWWRGQGRPTLVLHIDSSFVENGSLSPPLTSLLRAAQAGSLDGLPVQCGRLSDFRSTSCIHQLNFLKSLPDGALESTVDPFESPFKIFCDGSEIREEAEMLHEYYEEHRDEDLSGAFGSLYMRAGRNWSVLRICCGGLKSRHSYLQQAIVSLLVRQKRLTVGLPPFESEVRLPADGIVDTLHRICGIDGAALAQEIIIHLADFARSAPELLEGLTGLRTGLIVQLLANEVAGSLPYEAAFRWLLDTSPLELKIILKRVLIGQEVAHCHSKRDMSAVRRSIASIHSPASIPSSDGMGLWKRRRRLDGALNRTPYGFYQLIWKLLDVCRSEGIAVQGRMLYSGWTYEMTKSEIKFALLVESVMTAIAEPVYRQLLLETLTLFATAVLEWGSTVVTVTRMENILSDAHTLFLNDYKETVNIYSHGLSEQFCDLAPSGQYGTMTYITRALTPYISSEDDEVDCKVS